MSSKYIGHKVLKSLFFIYFFITFSLHSNEVYLNINNETHSSISSSVITPDKNHLVSFGGKSTKLWNLNDYTNQEYLGYISSGSMGIVFDASVDSNNTYLVTSGYFPDISDKNNGVIRVYDFKSRKLLKVLADNTIEFTSKTKFTNDGKYMISASKDGQLHVWENHSFDLIASKLLYPRDRFRANMLFDILYIKNNIYIVSSATDKGEISQINITSLNDLNSTISVKVTGNINNSLVVAGEYIYIGTSQNKLLKLDSKLKIMDEMSLEFEPTCLAVSPDKKNIAVAMKASKIFSSHAGLEKAQQNPTSISVFNFRDKTKVCDFIEHDNTVTSVAFLTNNKLISHGGDDHDIIVWDLNGSLLKRINNNYFKSKQVGIDKENIYFGYKKNIEVLDEYYNQQSIKKKIDKLPENERKQKLLMISENENKTVLHSNKIKYKLNIMTQKIEEVNTFKNVNNILSRFEMDDNSYVLFRSTDDSKLYLYNNTKFTDVTISKQGSDGVYHLKYGFLENENIISGGDGGILNIFNLKGEKIFDLKGHSTQIEAIAADNNHIISSDSRNIKLWDYKQINETNSTIYNQKFVDYLLKVGFTDAEIKDSNFVKLWKHKLFTKKTIEVSPKISILFDKSLEYVIWTEEGYFTVSSPKALKYISWYMNQGYDKEAIRYDIEKFYDVFFRPDLVKLKLQGKDIAPYTNGLTVKDALKNPPPEIKISMINSQIIQHKNDLTDIVEINTTKETVKVRFDISDFGGGVGTIRIYQEGKLIKTIGTDSIKKTIANVDEKYLEKEAENYLKEHKILALSKAVNGKSLNFDEQIAEVKADETISNKEGAYEIEVPLKSGDNYLSVEAFNKTNTISSFRSTVNINANIPKRKPKLYAIVAGVNKFDLNYVQDLKYALNDAKAIEQLVNNSKGEIFTDVETIYLKNDLVTKENIMNAFEEVKAKAFLEDTIIFYISTHGISANGKFYLVPSNNKRTDSLIEFGDIFKESSNIKSLNQIFIIDACQSGSANDIASAVYDSRASVLAKSSGIHLLSASTSGTNAFENDEYKHSNFTYQIIQAVNNKQSDNNKDGFISIIEVSDILRQQDLNNTKQFPVIQNIGNDIYLNRF